MNTLGRPPRRRLRTGLVLAAGTFLTVGLLGLIRAEPVIPRLSAAAAAVRPPPDAATSPSPPTPASGLVLMPPPRPRPLPPEPPGPAETPDRALAERSPSPELWRLAAGPPIEVRVGRARVLGAPVHLEDGLLEATEAGDLLSLPIPELGTLDVEIERIAEPTEGITILQGHLADPDESWPVSVTRGPELVLANVTTPTGTWIAEFSGGSGWIAPDDLEDRLVDHSISDARDPVAEGHAPGHP